MMFFNNHHQHPPPIQSQLTWLEWSNEHHMMLLADHYSVGAAFQVTPKPTDSMTPQALSHYHEQLTLMLAHLVPCHDHDPWVMQWYLSTTPLTTANQLKDYLIERDQQNDLFSQNYLQMQTDHLNQLSDPNHAFIDPMNAERYIAKQWQVRLTLYRRYHQPPKQSPIDELDTVANQVQTRLQQQGITVQRLTGSDLHAWWFRWFNPHPKHQTTEQGLQRFPFQPQQPLPHQIFLQPIQSNEQGWVFDGLQHRVLLCQHPNQSLPIGVFQQEHNHRSVIDQLPHGTCFTITIVFNSRLHMAAHLNRLEKATVGHDTVVQQTLDHIEQARFALQTGDDPLYRSITALYIREHDQPIDVVEEQCHALALNHGLLLYPSHDTVFPSDQYLRLLPFHFDPKFDQQYGHTATVQYASDITKQLPLYKRSQGDNQYPLHLYFNRSGEPFIFDQLHPNF